MTEALAIVWKTCGKCGETKPRSGFHKNPRERDGHHPFCKVCTNRYWRQNRARRKEGKRNTVSLKHALTEKKCASCGEIKPVDSFYRDSGHRGGLDRICKPCRKARSNAQRSRDLDRLRDDTDPLADLLDPPAPGGAPEAASGGYRERFVDDNAPVDLAKRRMEGYGPKGK